MQRIVTKFCTIAFVISTTFLVLGCQESESENIIQAEIDQLMISLEVATASNNESKLDAVISAASRLRPSVQSQKDSIKLMTSTAKGKLAHLKLDSINSNTNLVVSQFHLATHQSNEVAKLRNAATAFMIASEETGGDISPDMESLYSELQEMFSAQIAEMRYVISSIETKSDVARGEASKLREDAEALFIEADSAGLIAGHRTFKSGVSTMRHSQQVDMRANNLSLQKDILLQPALEKSKLEIEAAATILLGVKQTKRLLEQLRNTSIDSAAAMRQAADELDNAAATTMNGAIELSNNLQSQWSETISLLQSAIVESARLRNASREMQQASALWKLDMEWTLALAEETRKRFLGEQAQTLLDMANNGIVTSANKWSQLLSSTSEGMEQSLIAAIAAYENAKQIASGVGQNSEMLTNQLNRRIALLQGQPLPEFTTTPVTGTTSTPTNQTGSGFPTPQELIAAVNAASPITSMDGITPAPNLFDYYVAQDDGASAMLTFQNNLWSTFSNLFIAVRTHIGEDAIQQILSQGNGMPTENYLPRLDSTSITMTGENEATVMNEELKQKKLINTPTGWKIATASTPETEIAMMVMEMMSPIIDAMQSLIPQINDGTITSFEQLDAAMNALMESTTPSF